jgi:hypothetical protein
MHLPHTFDQIFSGLFWVAIGIIWLGSARRGVKEPELVTLFSPEVEPMTRRDRVIMSLIGIAILLTGISSLFSGRS